MMNRHKLAEGLEIAFKKFQVKNKRLIRTYGIDWQDFTMMLLKQDNKCWICQQLPKSGRLNIDHRHVKGYKKMSREDKAKEVRGLLCFMCNTALHGLEKRNNARFILERVVEYFKVYKIKGDL